MLDIIASLSGTRSDSMIKVRRFVDEVLDFVMSGTGRLGPSAFASRARGHCEPHVGFRSYT